jgi:hypothetical protein
MEPTPGTRRHASQTLVLIFHPYTPTSDFLKRTKHACHSVPEKDSLLSPVRLFFESPLFSPLPPCLPSRGPPCGLDKNMRAAWLRFLATPGPQRPCFPCGFGLVQDSLSCHWLV